MPAKTDRPGPGGLRAEQGARRGPQSHRRDIRAPCGAVGYQLNTGEATLVVCVIGGERGWTFALEYDADISICGRRSPRSERSRTRYPLSMIPEGNVDETCIGNSIARPRVRQFAGCRFDLVSPVMLVSLTNQAQHVSKAWSSGTPPGCFEDSVKPAVQGRDAPPGRNEYFASHGLRRAHIDLLQRSADILPHGCERPGPPVDLMELHLE